MAVAERPLDAEFLCSRHGFKSKKVASSRQAPGDRRVMGDGLMDGVEDVLDVLLSD